MKKVLILLLALTLTVMMVAPTAAQDDRNLVEAAERAKIGRAHV